MTDLKLRTSVAWLLADKAVRVISGVFVGAAVAKHLGPANYGLLAVAVATIAMFIAAANMGADHVNISEITKNNSDFSTYVVSIALARFAFSVVIALAAVAYALLLEGEEKTLILILVMCVPAAALSVFSSSLLARSKFSVVSSVSIAVLIASALVRLYGVGLNEKNIFFAWCAAVESIILPFLFFALLVKFGYLAKSKVNLACAKDYMRLCAPIAVSAVLVNVYLRLELLLVNYLAGQHLAGLWAAAMMFITPWNMVAASIMPVANSRLVHQKGDDSQGYEENVIRLIRVMFLLAVVLWVVNCAGVWLLVPVILGGAYEEIVVPVMIGSLNLIPLFAGCVQDVWLAHQRKTNVVLKKVIVGIPVSSLCLYFGTTHFGLMGTAVSMVMANLLTTIALNFVVDRKFLVLQIKAIFGRKVLSA